MIDDSTNAHSTALSENLDPHVPFLSTLRSKFSCRLVFGTFVEPQKLKGFTLIEVLIVISIIMIFAMTAVNSFTSYRQVAVLDLSQDFVTSFIGQVKAKAAHGRSAESGEAVCFGLRIEKGSNGLNTIQWPYDSRDFIEDADYKVGRCKQNASVLEEDFHSFDDKITVAGIFIGDTSVSQDELLLIYQPPDGNFDRYFVDKSASALEKRSFVEVLLKSNSGKERRFKIDLESGLVAK